MSYSRWKPYVPVGERRRKAAQARKKLGKKGTAFAPVVIEGRTIAKTFWGQSWCRNLERYSDYANRLPRGRTYARNGSILDLQIAAGTITATVSGSTLYHVEVKVTALSKARWSAVRKDCAGAIASLVELLQGKLSASVMTRMCDKKAGLFPHPGEITFYCSCPDWASMCKHVAAVLYGIGARLDEQPHLLFALRQVQHEELITKAGKDLTASRKPAGSKKILAETEIEDIFGIEFAAPAKKPRKKK